MCVCKLGATCYSGALVVVLVVVRCHCCRDCLGGIFMVKQRVLFLGKTPVFVELYVLITVTLTSLRVLTQS